MQSPVELFRSMREQAADAGLDVVRVKVRDPYGQEAHLDVSTSGTEPERIGRFTAMTTATPGGRHLEIGIGVTVAVPAGLSSEDADDILAHIGDLVDGRVTDELAKLRSDAGSASSITHLTEEDYHDSLLDDVASATESILMASPWTGRRMESLMKPLCEAVARGATVTLLIKPEHAGWTWAQRDLWKPLRDCGVEVVERHDSMHEKFVVIDDNITYQGSLNPGSHKDTTESSLRLEGPGPARVIRDLYHPASGSPAAAKEVRTTRPIGTARIELPDGANFSGGAWTEGLRWESRDPGGPYTPPDEVFDV